MISTNENMKSEHGTLVAATVTTVDLTKNNADVVVVHLVSGDGPIYFTLDGSTPTVGGANTFVVYAGMPSRAVQITNSNTQQAKLISATADDYAVEAL